MNKIILTSILFVAIGFSSCNKSVKKRLPGSWNIDNVNGTQTVSQTGMPDVTQTVNSNNEGTAVFNEDGTGTWPSSSSSSEDITWSATDATVTITFKSSGESATATVVTNEKKKQVWNYKYSYSQSSMGVTQSMKVDYVYTLSKK